MIGGLLLKTCATVEAMLERRRWRLGRVALTGSEAGTVVADREARKKGPFGMVGRRLAFDLVLVVVVNAADE